MSVPRVSQLAAIVSLVEIPNIRVSQSAAIVSITEIPNIRVSQLAAIISVSPGRPVRHSAINVRSRGPLNLFKDMPVSGKEKSI